MIATPASVERVKKCVFSFEIFLLSETEEKISSTSVPCNASSGSDKDYDCPSVGKPSALRL